MKLLRLAILIGLILAVAGCDQATKRLAQVALSGKPAVTLLAGSLKLVYTQNPGAMLGLGANLPARLRLLLSTLLVGGVLALSLSAALGRHRLTGLPLVGLALICGGGLGNLLDRYFKAGLVVDFLQLGALGLHTGVFNLADAALFAGLGLLAWAALRSGG
jgi:signal peptidase II